MRKSFCILLLSLVWMLPIQKMPTPTDFVKKLNPVYVYHIVGQKNIFSK